MFSGYLFSGHSQNFWVNLLGFNLIWSLCIFLGNDALIIVVILLLLHFCFHIQPVVEIQVVLVTGLMGYCIDCVLTILGVFRFENTLGITPLWLLLLWIGFCATLRQSLSFFNGKTYIAPIAGAIGGCFAYMAAANFNAVELTQSWLVSAVLIALIWAFLFPLLLWMSKSIEAYLCN
ncbi:MAG: DUF2878 domain-containing protein [Neptuniibacter sp.]